MLREHRELTRIGSSEHPIPKQRAPEHRVPQHPDRAWVTKTLPKFLPPFWRTLLGLLILPPLIASFFLYHVEMMVFLYYYTPFTAQNVDLIEFRDTD